MGPIYVIDTETTGLDGYPRDVIVDIGIAKVDLERGIIEDVFSSVVGHDTESWTIGMKNAWIFGHTDLKLSDVENAPPAEDVAYEVFEILANKHVTSFNEDFDFCKFLNYSPWNLDSTNVKLEPCLMKAADCVDGIPRTIRGDGSRAWPRLENAYAYLCPEDPEHILRQDHRALSNARLAGWVAIGPLPLKKKRILRHSLKINKQKPSFSVRRSDMEAYMIVLAVVLFIMIVLSSFFSMSETAFTSVSVFRLKELVAEGNKKAERALDVISDFDQFISVTLLSNNAVNITGTTVSTIIFAALVGVETGDFVATVFMLVVILLFGELLPKSYAKKNSLKVCLATAKIYQGLEAAIWPISWWLQALAARFGKDEPQEYMAKDMIHEVIDDAEKSGTLRPNSAKLLRNALVFDVKTVKDVCTPRDEIIYVRADEPLSNFLELVGKTRHSRIIVVDKDVDHPIGVAFMKDYVSLHEEYGSLTLRNIIRPVLVLPDTSMVYEAFDNMRRMKVTIAVLRSEDGRTVGVMTIEDALESLVGDIDDEEYNREVIGIGS